MRQAIALIVCVLLVAVWLVNRQTEVAAPQTQAVSGSSRLSELLGDQGVAGYAKAIDARDCTLLDYSKTEVDDSRSTVTFASMVFGNYPAKLRLKPIG